MRAGAYEHIISIMKHKVSQSESGEQREYWDKGMTTRAALQSNSGARTDSNNEIFYEYTKTFVVHRYVDVDEFDRICYKCRYYRILSIDEDRHLNQKTIVAELVNE